MIEKSFSKCEPSIFFGLLFQLVRGTLIVIGLLPGRWLFRFSWMGVKLTVFYFGRVGDKRGEMHLLLPQGFVKAVRIASCRVTTTDRITDSQRSSGHWGTAIQISEIIRRKIFKLVPSAPVTSKSVEIVERYSRGGSIISRLVVRARCIGSGSGRTLGRFSLQLKSHNTLIISGWENPIGNDEVSGSVFQNHSLSLICPFKFLVRSSLSALRVSSIGAMSAKPGMTTRLIKNKEKSDKIFMLKIKIQIEKKKTKKIKKQRALNKNFSD